MWLVTWKKPTGKPRVDYDAAVEEALCFGWVDSKSRSVDDERTSIYFTPRKPKSAWSESNVARIEKLEAAGLMAGGRPPGGRGGKAPRNVAGVSENATFPTDTRFVSNRCYPDVTDGNGPSREISALVPP